MTIKVEVDEWEIIQNLSDNEILTEYIGRVESKTDVKNMSLLARQNIEKLIYNLDKIDHFGLETFLNKY